MRKVKESGYVTIRNQGYYLSEAFSGKTIAVKESNKGQYLINLYFRQFRIGQIDIEKRVFTFKKAYLIENDPRFAEAKHKMNFPFGLRPHFKFIFMFVCY